MKDVKGRYLGMLQLGRSTVVLGMIKVLGVVLALILSVVLARSLGPEGLGKYALAMLAIKLLSIPLGRGWGTLLMRATARHEDEAAKIQAEEIFGLSRLLSLAYVSVLLLFAFGAVHFTSIEIHSGIIFLIGLALVVNQNNAFRMAILRGARFPVFAQFPEMILHPIVVVAVVLLLTGWFAERIEWYFAMQAFIGASLTTLLIGVLIQSRVLPEFRRRMVGLRLIVSRGWGTSALVMGLNGFVLLAFEQIDLILFFAFTDAANAGLYKVSMQLAVYGGFVYMLLNYVVAARFSALWQNNDLAEIEYLGRKYSRLSTAFAVVFALALYFFGDMFVVLLFGPDFAGAAAVAMLLALGQIASAMFGMSAALLIMSDNENYVVKGTIVLLFFKTVIGIAAIAWFGAFGMALTSSLSLLALNAYLFIVVRKRLGANVSAFNLVR